MWLRTLADEDVSMILLRRLSTEGLGTNEKAYADRRLGCFICRNAYFTYHDSMGMVNEW